ncbi:sensor histidine kinase [Caminibacter pacificus]|uniref:histidine kinase n=1 Tax=Caminibacter pacificus TaxID=1424653 RepID=A0AAJ4RD75_9BACT|nr:HAMP domain-containing sensor histidine kinase [Caminibacter pacificus]QCI28664.1 HAMP domain-containing histidine kinase [Caminibacter pacificus]ROR40607.1 histidine kinase/DNA gyrase B/HSP90-like ATPase [Caminibacter pacificus]
MRKTDEFKFDIITAFSIFAFLIIVAVTYTAIYIFTDITTQEFKDKVKLSADNIYYIYQEKVNNIKNATIALSNNDIFNTKFTVNPEVIKSVFKTMLLANSNLSEINYYNRYGKYVIGCEKVKNRVFCLNRDSKTLQVNNYKSNKNLFFKEYLSDKGLNLTLISPIQKGNNNGFIEVRALINKLDTLNSDLFYTVIINKKGQIFLSNFYKAKSIYDLFSYSLGDKILKTKEGFVTDDIYVKELSPNIKIVLIQNKNLINKTNEVSKKMVLIMIAISILLAIPLGIFFSKPLYKFYEELDLRVKEEIEKRQQKEQMLMHQSKLASLGEMLGNIAHQWRHPLTRLSLLIQNLEMAAQMNKLDKDFIQKFKEKAQAQIEYMSQTIDDFTNFFKKDTKKVEFCPKEIIEDALKLMEGRIKQNKVEVVLDIKKTEPILGYKTEFSQVVLNIINNAIDVLKERDIKDRKIFIRIDGKKIEIEDNAGGIPEEIKDKIFEPYFTTKFQSQGTGIGLYMSKIIISQHFKGKLYAYNSEKGAVFVIDLSN